MKKKWNMLFLKQRAIFKGRIISEETKVRKSFAERLKYFDQKATVIRKRAYLFVRKNALYFFSHILFYLFYLFVSNNPNFTECKITPPSQPL